MQFYNFFNFLDKKQQYFQNLCAIIANQGGENLITDEQTKVYTAKNDRLFKSIAHGKNGQEILEAILSTVFGEPVKILEFIPIELPLDTEKERKKTLDVLVKVGKKIINVEINAHGFSEITKIRNLAFICKLFSKHVSKGQEIDITTKFLQINFIFESKKSKRLVTKAYLTSEDGIYTENFSIWNIFVENVEELCYTDVKERERLRYILMLDKTPEELKDFFPNDEIIQKFRGEVVRLNSDAEFIREISEEDEKLLISKQEGKAEEKVDVIKNLVSVNSPIETIAIAVGLSVDDVKNIINENKFDTTSE